ncbi:acyl carrier protein [Variovorax davisae]|uniref:acyl carrier protein n=1 Tax=Variovorax davisae TaxID=3053515 RepID=UPI0033654449
MQTEPRAGEQSEVNQSVASIWKSILCCTAVGPSDDFFSSGGTSLAAVKFLAALEKCFGAEVLTPEELYKVRTFGAIASAVERHVQR